MSFADTLIDFDHTVDLSYEPEGGKETNRTCSTQEAYSNYSILAEMPGATRVNAGFKIKATVL